MEVLKRALPAAALLLAACEFTRDPVAVDVRGQEVMVHGVLAAGSDTVAVLLTRVRPGTGGKPVEVAAVSGAVVHVAGGGAAVQLVAAPAGSSTCVAGSAQGTAALAPGCYAAVLPGGVRPGATYELTVTLSGGAAIHGSATVPSAPAVRAPDASSRFQVKRRHPSGIIGSIGRIPARWTAGGRSVRIALGLRETAVFAGGRALPGPPCRIDYDRTTILPAEADSGAIVLQNPISCDQTAGTAYDSLHARVQVTAYDTAYARYAELVREYGSSPVQRDRFAAGVSGALGVFGAVATAERPVTLVAVD